MLLVVRFFSGHPEKTAMLVVKTMVLTISRSYSQSPQFTKPLLGATYCLFSR